MSHAGEPGEPTLTLPQFLELMNSDLQNEWTHLQFYLYHASSITGLHAEEYKEFFTDAAKGELEHVQAFLDRLFGLNVPMPNQSGHPFPCYTRVEDALNHAIKIENQVVENYAVRLRQLDLLAAAHPTTAAYLRIFYEDQLQDSYEDCEKIRRLMANDLIVTRRLT
jgi:bacterioferritin (cytochrome b1)